jgi:hypothetical protein
MDILLETLDHNVVRHVGMRRISSDTPTPFQHLLFYLSSNPKADVDMKLFFAVPPFENRNITSMFTNNVTTIMNCYNDNSRRYFESLFAKKILSHIQTCDRFSDLHALIRKLTTFYTSHYDRDNPAFLEEWKRAKQHNNVSNEDLRFFSLLRPHLVEFDSDILADLYDFHYLTHSISTISLYKKNHLQGICDLYHRSPYYSDKTRGRIYSRGWAQDRYSHNFGIFRSMDIVPQDMRTEKPSQVTRCPDRLYMTHPSVAMRNPFNWLHYFFTNPYNSMYVLGISGCILLEIRALMFYILCGGLVDNELLNLYFLIISSLLIYFEGGHSFTEIFTVFELPEVKTFIKNTVHEEINKDTIIYREEIVHLMKATLLDTVQYNDILERRRTYHDELLHGL